ncbi:MAG: sulfotransferase [Pseudomonadota bacterium]
MNTQIIFIASLPRSGSTLLQKMLSASPDVASSAEPWIMLPFWGMRLPASGRSVYFHYIAAMAINDFLDNIPNGERVYAESVGHFARHMYTAAAREKPVFLDKTPRYYLMLPLLHQALPEAKTILLLRNPLAVLASICETFNRGRFLWFEYWIDWIDGHRCLAQAIRENHNNQVVLRYEELVAAPDTTLKALCPQIGLEYTDAMITGYKSSALAGRMGDPVGVHRYAAVSSASINKWQTFYNTAYRRSVAEKMLRQLDPQDLETLGYPLPKLLEMLHATPPAPGMDFRSRAHQAIDAFARAVDFRYLQARWRAKRQGEPHAYGYYR